MTEDISGGGVKVISNQLFRIGTKLNCTISSSRFGIIKAIGEVVRTEETGQDFRLGIKFIEINKQDRNKVIGRITGLSKTMIMPLAPKSVTVPIAIEIAKFVSGDPALVAVFVVVTGLVGSVIGPTLLTRLKVTDPVARGIALGTTSHGQGTAVALQEGEMQGAMSGLAMALAGVLTSLIAPIYLSMIV